MQDSISNYTLYSMLFGGPLIFMQTISEWNTSTIAMVSQAITVFKEIRQTVKNGKVIHIKAPESHFSEEIPFGFGWDLIQSISFNSFNSFNSSRIVLQSCRAYGGEDSFLLQMQGVDTNANYLIHFYPSNIIMKETGQTLQSGFTLIQPESSCEILIFDLIN